MTEHSPHRRLALTIGLLALIAVSCGDALGGVGDISRRIVHGDEPPETTSTTAGGSVDLGLTGVLQAQWVNDGLDADTASLGRDDTIIAVWLDGERSNQIEPFVQASRREISHALPGIQFPQLIPRGVTHISSQLVYDPVSGTLGASTAAAFGLWVDVPYRLPRAEAQLAVLRVGLKTFAGDPEDEIFSFQVADGRELSWTHGDYVYQLFCRRGIIEDACFAIAESLIPLDLLLGVSG